MAEFCSCGSIIINGHCTRKSCTVKASPAKSSADIQAGSVKKEAKSTRTKKSSKCVTYNLYDIKSEENA